MKRTLRRLLRRAQPFTFSKAERRHALVGRADLWAMKREFQIRFLREAGLRPGHRLLEIGCGTLRGGLPVIDLLDAGDYVGVEVRAEPLAEARRELAEAGLEGKAPTLLLTPDLADVALDGRFDVVWAFSVLIHMSDDVLDGALGLAAGHLADGGAFYANVNVGEREDHHWQGFPVVWRTLAFYRAAAAAHGLAVVDLGPIGALGHASGVASQDRQRMLKLTRAEATAAGGPGGATE